MATVLAAAHTTSAQPQSVTLEARAQERYQTGREHYRTGDFDAAREAFATSLQWVDSPNTRMYLGRSLRQLGRLAEAYATLDRAAADAEERARTEPRYALTQQTARSEADALLPMVARLVVRVEGDPEGVRVTVNGQELPRGVWGRAVPMEAGGARILVTGDGVREVSRQVELHGGQTEEVEVSAEREPVVLPVADAAVQVFRDASVEGDAAVVPRPASDARGGVWRTTGAVTMLTGGAALGGGLALGLLALDGYNLLSALQITQRLEPTNPLIDKSETYRDAANVLFATGGGLLVTGLSLWLVGRFAWPERSGARVAWSVSPAGAIAVAGTF